MSDLDEILSLRQQLREARGEIARLRAALEEIKAEYLEAQDDPLTAGFMAVIAGKALAKGGK